MHPRLQERERAAVAAWRTDGRPKAPLGGPRPEPSLQARSPAALAVLARFDVAQCSIIEPFGAVLVRHFSRDRWLFAVGG